MRIRAIISAGTLMTLCSCSTLTFPGHLTHWSNGVYERQGDVSSVVVYHFTYDAANDRLTLAEQVPPHDTIGVITYEEDENALCNGPCSDFDQALEITWHYNEGRVSIVRKRAWEIGGNAILIASPKIERQGVWRLVSDAAHRQSLIGDEESTRRLRSMVGNIWLIYAAYVIRWSE